jgi:hypothetical protein
VFCVCVCFALFVRVVWAVIRVPRMCQHVAPRLDEKEWLALVRGRQMPVVVSGQGVMVLLALFSLDGACLQG